MARPKRPPFYKACAFSGCSLTFQARNESHKYCSPKCQGRDHSGTNHPQYNPSAACHRMRVCAQVDCKREFTSRTPGSIYCSKKCAGRDHRGPGHGAYKGGCLNHDGYRIIRVDRRAVMEHRWVMEQHIGRQLLPEERVHHIDGNRLNNAIENLELLPSESAHRRCHDPPRFRSETHKQCIRCGEIKPRAEFSSYRANPGGDQHDARCRSCKGRRSRELRLLRAISRLQARQAEDDGADWVAEALDHTLSLLDALRAEQNDVHHSIFELVTYGTSWRQELKSQER